MISRIMNIETLPVLGGMLPEYLERVQGPTAQDLYHFLLGRLRDPLYLIDVHHDDGKVNGFCLSSVAYYPVDPVLTVEHIYVKPGSPELTKKELLDSAFAFARVHFVGRFECVTYWKDIDKFIETFKNSVPDGVSEHLLVGTVIQAPIPREYHGPAKEE